MKIGISYMGMMCELFKISKKTIHYKLKILDHNI